MIKKIREGLKDPKKRAITSLILYGIFFIIVYFIITGAKETNINYTLKEENKIISYNYKLEIDENNNKLLIDGIYSDNESFIYNNNTYIIKDNLIYLNDLVVDNPIKYNVRDYYYDSIKELIKDNEFIEKTTYKDTNRVKTVYSIKVEDFFNNTNYECINNCLNDILITIYEEDYIDNVIIDLTSVNNYKYIIDIKYSEIKTSDN